MNFMTKLERKFGKFAIPNLTVVLIIGFIVGYMMEIFMPDSLSLIALNPSSVLHGQVYRLITWVLIPPSSASIFVIITLFFYFSIGKTLEHTLGEFAYTVYVVSGIVFTDLGVMLTYIFMKIIGQADQVDYLYSIGYNGATTYYLCMSLFLAYAFIYPEHQVLLYFIIPVKMKWLGYLDIIFLIYSVLQFGLMHYYVGMITVIMSVLNFIVFYFMTKRKGRVSGAHKKRKRQYHQQVRQTQIMTRHKCCICGQTEQDNPELEFRYCSRCKGNHEYCQNHLFTHEHKK